MLLIAHIVCGALGLVTGLLAMLAQKRPSRHPLLGTLYVGLVMATGVTGITITLTTTPDTGLVFLGGGMMLLAGAGWLAARKRPRRWLLIHAPAQMMSYLFMLEAAVITNWELLTLGYTVPTGYAWLLPALVIYPAIGWVVYRIVRRSRAA